MVRASAVVRLSVHRCPFHAYSFQQEARQNRSSKSIVIVLKQQQQHPPHNIHTWSSLFSSIDGAEPLNNDLQRLSEFLLHDINQANFSTRLHNNKSLAFICLDSNRQRNGLAANYTSTTTTFIALSSCFHYRLTLTIVLLLLSSTLAFMLPFHRF